MSRAEQSRAGDVDLLRALGIIFMIMGHVQFGLNFDKWIHGFHMPLWFMISGFFLNTKRETWAYLKRKTSTILIPYLFFGIMYEIIWTIAGYNQWQGLIWPNSVEVPLNGALWFLPALFFVDVIGFMVYKYLNRLIASLLLTLLALLGCFHIISLPFSLDSALVGCGFFMAGCLIRWFCSKLLKIKLLPSLGLLVVASVLIFLNGYVNVRTNVYAIMPLFWFNSISVTIALWNICRWIDENNSWPRLMMRYLNILKVIGSDSLIYVCMNQFVLLKLNELVILEGNIIVMRLWHLVETAIIIAVCFVINILIKRTPMKIMLGK